MYVAAELGDRDVDASPQGSRNSDERVSSVAAQTGRSPSGSRRATDSHRGCSRDEVPKLLGGVSRLCGEDKDTTYSGKDFVVSGQGCPEGSYASGADSEDGKFYCAAFPSPPPTTVYARYSGAISSVKLSEPDDRFPRLFETGGALPPGKYLVDSQIVVRNMTAFALQDDSRVVRCALYAFRDGPPGSGDGRVAVERIDGGAIGAGERRVLRNDHLQFCNHRDSREQ
jgi:hypothetical protein